MERRVLIPIRFANKSAKYLDDSDIPEEYENEESEYFSWRQTSFDIDDLKMLRFVESEDDGVTLIVEPTGEVVRAKISLTELHNKINKFSFSTWN